MNWPKDIGQRLRQESKDLRIPLPIRNRSVLCSLPPRQLAGFSVLPAPEDDRQKALNGCSRRSLPATREPRRCRMCARSAPNLDQNDTGTATSPVP